MSKFPKLSPGDFIRFTYQDDGANSGGVETEYEVRHVGGLGRHLALPIAAAAGRFGAWLANKAGRETYFHLAVNGRTLVEVGYL